MGSKTTKSGKGSRKHGRNKRKAQARLEPLSLFIRNKITPESYFRRIKSSLRWELFLYLCGMKKIILILILGFLTSCAVENKFTGYYDSIYEEVMVKEKVLVPTPHVPYYSRRDYRNPNYNPYYSNPMLINMAKYYDSHYMYRSQLFNSFDDRVIDHQRLNIINKSVKKSVLNLEKFEKNHTNSKRKRGK